MDHYIAIGIVFAAAIYLVWHFRRQLQSNSGCDSACNKGCSSKKWEDIEAQIPKKIF